MNYLYFPSFFELFNIYKSLIRMQERHGELFYDKISIGAIYGCFPGSVWNGGRFSGGTCDKSRILDVMEFYNNHEIPIRFTYTNQYINETFLDDSFCNWILEVFNNGINQVIVNSSILEKYIRTMYPRYKLISSTTKCITDYDELLLELEKDYYMTVIDYRYNNTEALMHIPNKDKCELLLNAYCFDNCVERKKHYEAVDLGQIRNIKKTFHSCEALKRDFYDIFDNKSFISVEKMLDWYVPNGFHHFKVEGRGYNTVDVIESIVYYFVKAEYRDIVRLKLLKEMRKSML